MGTREQVSHDGIGARYETYNYDATVVFDATKAGNSAQTGKSLTLVSAGTVGLAGDGKHIEGKLILVESDGCCNVQTGGKTDLPGGDGATLTVGSKIVGALGPGGAADKGYIRSVAAATLAEVAVADGEIIDASTATAVVVEL